MHRHSSSRREFLGTISAAAISSGLLLSQQRAYGFFNPNDRPVVGCIGTGSRWNGVGPAALKFADCAAICDVDANHANKRQEPSAKGPGY